MMKYSPEEAVVALNDYCDYLKSISQTPPNNVSLWHLINADASSVEGCGSALIEDRSREVLCSWFEDLFPRIFPPTGYSSRFHLVIEGDLSDEMRRSLEACCKAGDLIAKQLPYELYPKWLSNPLDSLDKNGEHDHEFFLNEHIVRACAVACDSGGSWIHWLAAWSLRHNSNNVSFPCEGNHKTLLRVFSKEFSGRGKLPTLGEVNGEEWIFSVNLGNPIFTSIQMCRNLIEHIEALKKIRVGLPEAAEPATPEGQDIDIPLSDSEQELLQAAFELQAFDSDSRKTAEEIVKEAVAPTADTNSYKNCLANLVENKFLESKQGSGGGYWLTKSGKERAEKLKNG
jgi:hypothetical protein